MFTSGVVIQYIGCGFLSLNPQEIYYFKFEFCVQFVWLFRNVTLAYNKTCLYLALLHELWKTVKNVSQKLLISFSYIASYWTEHPKGWTDSLHTNGQ
jgi:hypothetical protein